MKITAKIKSRSRILFLSAFILCCTLSKVTAQKMTFNPMKTDNGLIFGSMTFPEEKPVLMDIFIDKLQIH